MCWTWCQSQWLKVQPLAAPSPLLITPLWLLFYCGNAHMSCVSSLPLVGTVLIRCHYNWHRGVWIHLSCDLFSWRMKRRLLVKRVYYTLDQRRWYMTLLYKGSFLQYSIEFSIFVLVLGDIWSNMILAAGGDKEKKAQLQPHLLLQHHGQLLKLSSEPQILSWTQDQCVRYNRQKVSEDFT